MTDSSFGDNALRDKLLANIKSHAYEQDRIAAEKERIRLEAKNRAINLVRVALGDAKSNLVHQIEEGNHAPAFKVPTHADRVLHDHALGYVHRCSLKLPSGEVYSEIGDRWKDFILWFNVHGLRVSVETRDDGAGVHSWRVIVLEVAE